MSSDITEYTRAVKSARPRSQILLVGRWLKTIRVADWSLTRNGLIPKGPAASGTRSRESAVTIRNKRKKNSPNAAIEVCDLVPEVMREMAQLEIARADPFLPASRAVYAGNPGSTAQVLDSFVVECYGDGAIVTAGLF